MTKADLVETIAKQVETTKAAAEKMLNTVFDTIVDVLKKGGDVKIPGFGKFLVQNKKARTSRNPKTGEAIQVPAKKAPKFRPAKELKESLK